LDFYISLFINAVNAISTQIKKKEATDKSLKKLLKDDFKNFINKVIEDENEKIDFLFEDKEIRYYDC
tara:strand:+ start:59 stop:259 length:201 start_codon:yes stop_codon:yes gene_type:complete